MKVKVKLSKGTRETNWRWKGKRRRMDVGTRGTTGRRSGKRRRIMGVETQGGLMGRGARGGRITCVGQMPFPYICNKNREHEKKIRR